MQNVKRPLIIVLLGSLLLPVGCVASERAYLTPGDKWPSDWHKISYALGWSALYAVALIGQYLYRLAQRRKGKDWESRQPRGVAPVIEALYGNREVSKESQPKKVVSREAPFSEPAGIQRIQVSSGNDEKVSLLKRRVIDDMESEGNKYILRFDRGIVSVLRNDKEFLTFSLPSQDGLVKGELFEAKSEKWPFRSSIYALVISPEEVIYLGRSDHVPAKQFQEVGKASAMDEPALRAKLSAKEFNIPPEVQESIIKILERLVNLKPWLEPIEENE